MPFVADLHIHSKYSRATSKQCDLPHLHAWAKRKGITVVGTGDFTHPGWLAELEEGLEEAEEGLYRLREKDALAAEADLGLPGNFDRELRFCLTAEISNIYKKNGRTRKNHNMLLAPTLADARAIHEALDRIGNVRSDGRPILGLDARDLLEIVLENAPGAYLIPAHVWTPWFSLLGSKSGFDAVEECFEDLTGHIFALETGLSSDPPMNWRLSDLDRYTLVSHSDAHSPAKLGREADLFACDLSFSGMRRALETGEAFEGTIEFFPEEGKYHLDGHRKCDVCWTPEETRRNGGHCSVCGKPVVVGVLNRVAQLADRDEGVRPDKAAGFKSLVPLAEIVGECLSVGPGSKKVERTMRELLAKVGPELDILLHADPRHIASAGGALVGEAVRRMREGRVFRQGGYDGEYGVVKVFAPGERDRLQGQTRFFDVPETDRRTRTSAERESEPTPVQTSADPTPLFDGAPVAAPKPGPSQGLNDQQALAVAHGPGPLLIVAGPGTGKTMTLVRRMARMISDGHAAPEDILAVSFTNQAAREVGERLRSLVLRSEAEAVTTCTFHGLCIRILRLAGRTRFRILGESESRELFEQALDRCAGLSRKDRKGLAAKISMAKREGLGPEEAGWDDRFAGAPAAAYNSYRALLEERDALDFDDLLLEAVSALKSDEGLLDAARRRWPWISVDEFQDINAIQYDLIRLLAPPGANLCAIGDPDQAIYGFRGADPGFFRKFEQAYPGCTVIRLERNYRSCETILSAAAQVMEKSGEGFSGPVFSGLPGERIVTPVLATERAEAEFVAHTIERSIGGVSFFSHDSGRLEGASSDRDRSFSDFAVLFRTEAQAEPVVEALTRLGLPHSRIGSNLLLDEPVFAALHDRLKNEGLGDAGSIASRLDGWASDLDGEAASAARSLVRMAGPFRSELREFLNHIALGVEVDAFDPRADRIACMTLHAAKGLEFPIVFVVGCEDGVLPLRFGGKCDDIEEERRLFFVGLTRARERLYLCRARRRKRYGQPRENAPSPFLLDIEQKLCRSAGMQGGRKKPKGPRQLELF